MNANKKKEQHMALFAKSLSSGREKGKVRRYVAVDVLRGLTVALMILVNTPGSWSTIYAPFKHAEWHGFTLTDLVFPSFLFVVGNALSFSIKKFKEKRNFLFLKRISIRSVIIFAIGLFLSAFPFVYRVDGMLLFKDLAEMRIMGVLQRIALAYFFAALIVKYFRPRIIAALGATILLLYWILLLWWGSTTNPFSLEGNAVLKVDLLIMSPENLWNGFGLPFDPEGLLSTFPSVVNVLGGYLAGIFIQKSGHNLRTVGKMAGVGIFFLLMAELWDHLLPINKPLWTSSYVLLTIGWDLVLLAALVWIIEILGIRRWTYFFEVFGKNPLFIYVMSGVLTILLHIIWIEGTSAKTLIYDNLYLTWLTEYNASLGFAVSYVVLLWFLGYWMDRKRIYVKV